ncbi:triple tyrosine motif-containing protein, partial [Bacteroidota bacterium]
MRNKIIITLFVCFLHQFSFAQVNKFGFPEVVHYPPEVTKGAEQNWSIVQDHRGVMYFGNDEKGVLEYDGTEWRAIPIPNNSYVRSLACSDEGIIYVGAVSELGYLTPDHSGLLTYKSLLPKIDSSFTNFTNVWKTYCVKDKVLFFSMRYLFIYYPEKDSIHTVINPSRSLFSFYEHDKLYGVPFSPDGLIYLQGDTTWVRAKGGEYYAMKDVFGLTTYDDDELLICDANFGLTLYNINTGEVNENFAPGETNRYLNENSVTLLTPLSDRTFFAATQSGGAVVIDQNGVITEIAKNYGYNKNLSIWYAKQTAGNYPYSHLWTALNIGIGRISFESPLRSFHEDAGFSGLIFTINSLGEKIFLGTGNGLYSYEVDNNIATFKKVEKINYAIRDLEKFKLPSGETVLLAFGEAGFYEVHKNGVSIDLTEKIQGLKNQEDKRFWGFSLLPDPSIPGRVYLGMENRITALMYKNGAWTLDFSIDSLINGDVSSLEKSLDGVLFFGTNFSGIGSITETSNGIKIYKYGIENNLPTQEYNTVFKLDDDIVIGTSDGIYRPNLENVETTFYKDSMYNEFLPEGVNTIYQIYTDPDSSIWISFNNSILGYRIVGLEKDGKHNYHEISGPFLNLGDYATEAFYSHEGNDIWFSLSNELFHLEKEFKYTEKDYPILMRKVTLNDDSVLFNGTFYRTNENERIFITRNENPENHPILSNKYRNIEFRWSSPFYEHEELTEYTTYLEGFSKRWTSWDKVNYQDFTNLSAGKYKFIVKAKNIFNQESEPTTYSFTIKAPWYFKWYAIILYIAFFVLIGYFLYILFYNRRLQFMVSQQTEELKTQNEILYLQNKEITDSINYAQRIQTAILPKEEYLEEILPEQFVLYKPRDVVSGDFYWIKQIKNFTLVVAGDCTGHGVPGAFMSMLGVAILNEVTGKSRLDSAGEILDRLRHKIKVTLSQEGTVHDQKDGMDLSLIILNSETNELQFAGAFNPIYIIRKEENELNTDLKEYLSMQVEGYSLYVFQGD